MRKLGLILFMAILFIGCQSTRQASSVHQPPVPGKPPNIPSEPGIVLVPYIIPHPDKDEDKPRKRKKDPPHTRPAGNKDHGKRSAKEPLNHRLFR